MILVSTIIICAQCRTVLQNMVEKFGAVNEVVVELPEDWAFEDGVHLCPDCRTPGWQQPREITLVESRAVEGLVEAMKKDLLLQKAVENPSPEQGETIGFNLPANRFTTIPRTEREPDSLQVQQDSDSTVHHTFLNKENHDQ